MPQVIEPPVSSAEKASGRQLHTASLNEAGKEHNTRTRSNAQTASSSKREPHATPASADLWRLQLRDLLCDFLLRSWMGWQPMGAEVDRFRTRWARVASASGQHAVAGGVCSSAQRDGSSGLQAVVDSLHPRIGRTEHLCPAVESGALVDVLAMAALGRRHLERRECNGPVSSPRDVRLRLAAGVGNHFLDQPLRPVWFTPGMALRAWKGISAAWLRHSRTLPVGEASALCGLAVCVLVHADDDRSTPLVCRCDNSLHPGCDST